MRLDPEMMRKTGAFSLVSAELAACTGGGFYLGQVLDGYFGFHHILDIGLLLLGFVIAMRRIVLWYGKENERK